jgi:hypothetical protein
MAIGAHEFLNAFINNSSTVTENAGADIAAPAHKAVMYNLNGDVVIATSGDKAIGVILSDTPDPVKAGEQVHIQIKYIGLLIAAGAITKGDFITINATGQGITAAEGDFIFGRAFTAVEAGEAVQVQINPMGYIPVPEE